jgi:hypothetical protein
MSTEATNQPVSAQAATTGTGISVTAPTPIGSPADNTIGYQYGSAGETIALDNLSLAERQKIQQVFDENPAIKNVVEQAYSIDPGLETFQPITANLVTGLAAEVKRIGFEDASQNFLKQAQNLVGFGEATWFQQQNRGNTKWANYQKAILSYSPVLPQAEWEASLKKYTDIDRNLVYRDPISGRGVAVLFDEIKREARGLVYLDSDGERFRSSIFASPDLYREAETFGIDLSGISVLNDKLTAANIKFLPSQLYKGSDAGINFDNIANYSSLAVFASSDYVKNATEQAQAQWAIAEAAGFTIPQSQKDAELLVIQQTHEMALRTEALRNGNTSGELSVNQKTIVTRVDTADGIVTNYSAVSANTPVDAASSNLYSSGPSSSTAIAAAGAVAASAARSGVNFTAGPGGTDILTNSATGAVTGVVDGVTGAVQGVVSQPGDIAAGLAGQANGLVAGAGGAAGAVGGLIGQAGSVASLALAGYQSAASALSSAESLISGAIRNPPQLDASLSPFIQAAQNIGSGLSTSLNSIETTFGAFGEQFSTLLKAKNQATLNARYNQAASNDWRVRLSLAPGADYLYMSPESERGILGPLFDTKGVIFPYMPSIETSYVANYDKYDLVHSNYRGYFYKNSAVNDVNIRATFTAQDTQEANYLLAVIHFFRSVTKMFYGQDPIRGAPPPLVYLSGLGDYQFNGHPCLVSNFSYSLPNDVDYIRALAPNNYGNLFSKRERTGSSSSGLLGSTATRLVNAGLNAINPSQPNVPTPSIINTNVNNLSTATYVPTKIEINISLLPTNTRAQVSQQFSVKDFANGKLIKGGFW